MEIELKYSLPDKQIADNIWEDSYLDSISDNNSAENLVMKAVYFDTEDLLLSKNGITVRVRSEGDSNFATLKSISKGNDGLFKRDELNVPITDESSFMALDPMLFKGSEEGDRMIKILDGKMLINLLEMHFLRRRKRIAYASSIIELAIDTGTIITDKGEKPINEIELELFAGNEDSISHLGLEIANKYGLNAKNTSKFQDGLDML